jgi:hypothetical protein
MTKKIVEVGDFCKMRDSSFLTYGLDKGDMVYIAGDAIVSVTEDDPYSLRRIFIGAFMKDGHVQIHEKPFTVDGKRLKVITGELKDKLTATKEFDFGSKEPDEPSI